MAERLLTVQDVAKCLSVHTNTVWNRVRQNAMPKPVKFGNCTRWRESQIDAYIESLFSDALAD